MIPLTHSSTTWMMSEATPMPAPSTESGSAMKEFLLKEPNELSYDFLGSKMKAMWRCGKTMQRQLIINLNRKFGAGGRSDTMTYISHTTSTERGDIFIYSIKLSINRYRAIDTGRDVHPSITCV